MAGAKRNRTWQAVHKHALGLPEAWEDHPWDEVVAKVRKKVFVFLGTEDSASPGMSVKLTESHGHALSLEGSEPTGYGLGKAGWVSVRFGSAELDLLRDWVEESYRNVAPKTLVAKLDQ